MPVPILSTKLFIPSIRRRLVSRPRLIEQLNQGLENKFILISAPAGYGKTTLLSAWLNQYPLNVAWVSMDEGDNDLAHFLAYLVAALQKIHGEIGKTMLTMLQSPQILPTNVLLSSLINDIAQVQDQFILILDDYHVIHELPVHQAVNFLLEQLPWQIHLVISTRADPPFQLARLRAGSQMLEIRAEELCFNAQEAKEFFNKAMGLSISEKEIETLAFRTEGWIAGLQMAAVSMQGRQDSNQFVQDFAGSNRHILDYLLEEVLNRQPPAIQEFLLKTSILNDLNGLLCDAVTCQDNGQETLERLERANLFIVALDDQRNWYRYHHLFSDVLRQRLMNLQPAVAPALHIRASEWYAENGRFADAIRHAFSAGDLDRTACLIEQSADTSLMHGELQTFLSWVERVPESIACQYPKLCVYHSEALLLSGRPIDQVAARLKNTPEYSAVKALIAAYQGNVELSKELCKQALDYLPKESVFLRGAISSALGAVLLLSGEVEPAIMAFRATEEISHENANLIQEVISLCRLGQLFLMKAELRKAEDFFKKALELSSDHCGGFLPIASMPLTLFAYLLREWNDVDQALSIIQKAVELTQASGGFWSVDCYAVYAFVLRARGDLEGALKAIQSARNIASLTVANRFDDIYTAAYEAQLLVAAGNLEAALRWERESNLKKWAGPADLAAETRLSSRLYHLVEIEQTTLARIHLAGERAEEALEILDALFPETEKRGRRWSLIENLVLQSLAYQSTGKITEAVNKIQTALSMAEPGGFVRIFVNEGYPMRQLLKAVASGGKSRQYVPRLLANFGDGKTDQIVSATPFELIEPLSERELEVLNLVAAGHSNNEIAERLVISLSTVKGHTENIFGKLGVHNRTQAVARARQLRLIS